MLVREYVNNFQSMLNKGAVDSDHAVDLSAFCLDELGEFGPNLVHNVR